MSGLLDKLTGLSNDNRKMAAINSGADKSFCPTVNAAVPSGGDVPVGCFVERANAPAMMVSWETGNDQNRTFADCRALAIKHGFPFVGLQARAPGSERGACVFSNDSDRYKAYGTSTACRQVGNVQVGDANNNFVYYLPGVTPKPFTAPATPANPPASTPSAAPPSAGGGLGGPRYVGCYNDSENRTMMPVAIDPYVTFDACRSMVAARGYRYMGAQNGNADGTVQCWGSNNLGAATQLGSSNKCTRFSAAGRNIGGDWATALYDTQ